MGCGHGLKGDDFDVDDAALMVRRSEGSEDDDVDDDDDGSDFLVVLAARMRLRCIPWRSIGELMASDHTKEISFAIISYGMM